MKTLAAKRKALIAAWRKRMWKFYPGEWRRGHDLTDMRYGREYDLAMKSLKISRAPAPKDPEQLTIFSALDKSS